MAKASSQSPALAFVRRLPSLCLQMMGVMSIAIVCESSVATSYTPRASTAVSPTPSPQTSNAPDLAFSAAPPRKKTMGFLSAAYTQAVSYM